MPLNFLNPGLLLGLLAAAIPIIIHFLSRHRLRRVAFSDLRFLQEEEAQQARRRGLRRWLLLLLRVLIIICLVLAAARPHLGGMPGGGRTTLFVIDASASMQAQQDDGRQRFEVALAAVGEMMTALPPDALVQVILAGPDATTLFADWLPAGPAARAALADAEVTDGASDLDAALRRAVELAGDAPSRPVELIYLSDLQAGNPQDLDEAFGLLASADIRVLIHAIGDALPTGAVLDVALPGRALQPGETVTVTATVRPERADQAFWVELDGRRLAEAVAPTPESPGAAVRIPFTVTTPAAGLHRGLVGKDADRLAVDDQRAFVLDVPHRIDVLIAHGDDRDGLGRGGWRYLERALAPDARSADLFSVRSVPVDSLLTVGLGTVDLLVLADIGSPGRRLTASLQAWLDSGGALFVMAGDPVQTQDLQSGLLPMLDLPATATWVVRPDDQAERARLVDPDHPLLADLGDEAADALAAARWWRYHAIDEAGARVILAADSGAPLLIEGQRGRGRWLLAPFHLRREATDLMLNPMIVPLLQRAALRLVAGGGQALTLTVGEDVVLPVASARLGLEPGDSAADLGVTRPHDDAQVAAELRWLPSGPALAAPSSARAGIYTFTARGDTVGLVATTVPATELESRLEGTEEVANRWRQAGVDRVATLGDEGASLAVALSGRGLARWLLVVGLLLMAVELWIGRRVT